MSERLRRTASFVAEIDPCEVGVRFLGTYLGIKPPPHCKTAREAVETMDQEDQVRLLAAAEVVLRYVAEQISSARRPS